MNKKVPNVLQILFLINDRFLQSYSICKYLKNMIQK